MSSDSDSSCDDWARLDVDTVQSKEAKLAEEREFERNREEKRQAHIELQREIIRMEKKVSAMVLAIDKRSKELTRLREEELGRMDRKKDRLVQKINAMRWAAMCTDAGKPLR